MQEKCENISFGRKNINGDLPDGCQDPQYQKVSFSKFALGITNGNNCCILIDGSIVYITNFSYCQEINSMVVIGKKILNKQPLYKTPCDSSLLDIYKVDTLSELSYWNLNEIRAKCIKLPLHDSFAIFPLLHL